MSISLILLSSTVMAGVGDCGTPELLPLTLATEVPSFPPAPTNGDKSTRDLYSVPNSLDSDNFVVRWGDDGDITEQLAEEVLDELEYSWSVQVDEMGYPEPLTTNAYKLNVYITGTGSGPSSLANAAGYYTTDPSGYPMIALSSSTLDDLEVGRTTIAHELYHALQHATGSYDYSGRSAWYWEATASWIEVEVYPDEITYAAPLFAFAMKPHYALDFFDYPDTGAFDEYYQYGAFIFPLYVSEQVTSWETIRNSWVAPGSASTPLEAIEIELESHGLDFEEVVAEFAAHNVAWDYRDGDIYDTLVDYVAGLYPEEDKRIAVSVGSDGTDGWVSPETDVLPESRGYSVISVDELDAEAVRVRFTGARFGSEESEASWKVIVVEPIAFGHDYHSVELLDGEGEIEFDSGKRFSVVVVPTAVDGENGETFDYAIEVEPFTPGDEEPGEYDGDSDSDDDDSVSHDENDSKSSEPSAEAEQGARGCSTLPGVSSGIQWTWLLAGALLGLRRRSNRTQRGSTRCWS